MTFSYWFVETWCLINFIGGAIFGGIAWHRYGDKAKKIWKNISK